MKFDNLEYRKTLGKFVTGVTIITTCEKVNLNMKLVEVTAN